jgi:hypothetical protein
MAGIFTYGCALEEAVLVRVSTMGLDWRGSRLPLGVDRRLAIGGDIVMDFFKRISNWQHRDNGSNPVESGDAAPIAEWQISNDVPPMTDSDRQFFCELKLAAEDWQREHASDAIAHVQTLKATYRQSFPVTEQNMKEGAQVAKALRAQKH